MTEDSHDVGIVQHQLVSMNIFFHLFCCEICIFVTQLPLQTWGLRVSCTEFPAATAQPRACCMSEFRIKHAECREQLEYIPYDENENINKEIKKPMSKIKIAVTTIETV